MQVIKVGTSSLVRIEKKSINISALSLLCETVRNLKEQGQASSLKQPVARALWLSKQSPTSALDSQSLILLLQDIGL